jgi:hypothetical protein
MPTIQLQVAVTLDDHAIKSLADSLVPASDRRWGHRPVTSIQEERHAF